MITIRRVRPEEYGAVGEITLAAYAPHLHGTDDYAAQLRDTARRDREAEVWVAADDSEEVLGSVTLCPPGSPWRELSKEGEGEFRMLSVAPDAQGQGVGQSLVEFVVDHFRFEGATSVVLCSSSDMSAAHRMYDRLGFVREPDLDWAPLPEVSLLAFRMEL